jgi:hypothetical protein
MYHICAQTGQWASQRSITVTRRHRLQGGRERSVGRCCVKAKGLKKADKLTQCGAARSRDLAQQFVDTVLLLHLWKKEEG